MSGGPISSAGIEAELCNAEGVGGEGGDSDGVGDESGNYVVGCRCKGSIPVGPSMHRASSRNEPVQSRDVMVVF